MRQVEIATPAATSCYNHPAHNPLRLRTVRGPLWTFIPALTGDGPPRSMMFTPDLWPLQQGRTITAVPISGVSGARRASLRANPVSEVGVAISARETVVLATARDYWEAWVAENDPPPSSEYRWNLGDYSTGLGMVLEWFPKSWRRHMAEGNLEALRQDLRPFQYILTGTGISAMNVFVLAFAIDHGRYDDPRLDAEARLWWALWKAGQEIEPRVFRPEDPAAYAPSCRGFGRAALPCTAVG